MEKRQKKCSSDRTGRVIKPKRRTRTRRTPRPKHAKHTAHRVAGRLPGFVRVRGGAFPVRVSGRVSLLLLVPPSPGQVPNHVYIQPGAPVYAGTVYSFIIIIMMAILKSRLLDLIVRL